MTTISAHLGKYRCLGFAIGALALAACLFVGSGSAPGSEARRNQLLGDGNLKVAVVSAPPISAIDPATKRAIGYAVDVVDAIAHRAKLKVEYVPADWGTMGAALASGRADLVIGPIFMTEGRARDFIFTDPLFSYAIVPVVARGSTRIKVPEDMKTPGLRIAVGRGGFDAEFVDRNLPQAKQSVFPPDDPTLPMLEIIAGRADLALVDFGTARKFVAEHAQVEIRFEDQPASIQYAGFMLRRDDLWLRDFVNLALRNLDLAGELATIDARYADQKSWYGRVSTKPNIIR